MDQRLKTSFLGKQLQSPLVLASGVMGISYSGMVRVIEYGCGMVTTKSFTIDPRKGHDGPVVAEFAGGFINSMGLSNPGIHEGLKEVEDFKRCSDAPVIVSIFAVTTLDFISLVRAINNSNADFIELNLSCPNVSDEYGVPLAASKEKVFEIIKEVKKIAKKPVIAKLSPNTFNVVDIALSAQSAGADALTLINTLGPGMLIDIHARKPVILNKFGGVSGAAIKPIALKLVYEISKKISIPIIGTGGIMNGDDAVEYLLAGAALMGVGTAVYNIGIDVFSRINDSFLAYLDKHNLNSISDIKPI